MNVLALFSLLIASAYGQDWSGYWTQSGPGKLICSDIGQLPPPGFGSPKFVNGEQARDGYELSFSPPLLRNETMSATMTAVMYEPNTEYTITLQNENGRLFGGFFVAPVSSPPTGSNFSNPTFGGQVLDFGCSWKNDASRGIGHTNGNILRTSVSAKWTAPASGDFDIAMTVKEDTDMENGKWIWHQYAFTDKPTACSDYADDNSCQAPAVFDEDARCSTLFGCPSETNFGNASTNCCKLPAPSPTTPKPTPETPEPTTPSASGDSDDTQNTATTTTLSAVVGILFLASIL